MMASCVSDSEALFAMLRVSLPDSLLSHVGRQGRGILAQTCRSARNAVADWRKGQIKIFHCDDELNHLLPFFCKKELNKRRPWTFDALQRELAEEVIPDSFKYLGKESFRSLARAVRLSKAKLKLLSPDKVAANGALLRCVLRVAYHQSLVAITSLAMDGPALQAAAVVPLEKKVEAARGYLAAHPALTSLAYPRSWRRPRMLCLPKEVFALRELQHLILGGQRIRILPSFVGSLSKLRLLELDDNCLFSIPESIKRLSALSMLNLNRNRLASLPDGIGSLRQLRFLEVEDNVLTIAPASIKNLKALRDLCLSGNKLSFLPKGIGALSALSCLRVAHNRLSSIPKEFRKLHSLQIVELCGNLLPEVPAYFRKRSSLKII